MDITQQVLDRASRNVQRILIGYAPEIAEAFLKADDALSVGLTVEFKPKGSGIKITTKINFIESRVKDQSEDEVYPPDPIQIAIERANREKEEQRKIGNSEGTWVRMRMYNHR